MKPRYSGSKDIASIAHTIREESREGNYAEKLQTESKSNSEGSVDKNDIVGGGDHAGETVVILRREYELLLRAAQKPGGLSNDDSGWEGNHEGDKLRCGKSTAREEVDGILESAGEDVTDTVIVARERKEMVDEGLKGNRRKYQCRGLAKEDESISTDRNRNTSAVLMDVFGKLEGVTEGNGDRRREEESEDGEVGAKNTCTVKEEGVERDRDNLVIYEFEIDDETESEDHNAKDYDSEDCRDCACEKVDCCIKEAKKCCVVSSEPQGMVMVNGKHTDSATGSSAKEGGRRYKMGRRVRAQGIMQTNVVTGNVVQNTAYASKKGMKVGLGKHSC